MHRRNSVLEQNEQSNAQATQANPTTSAQPSEHVNFNEQKIVSEAFDATAAALSRLTVMTESHFSGQTSPTFDGSATYETAVMTSCPSPGKRSSEYFDMPLSVSNLKRLRTDDMLDSIANLETSSSLCADEQSCYSEADESMVEGLGISNLCYGPSREISFKPSWTPIPVESSSSVVSKTKYIVARRRRAQSAPPSTSIDHWTTLNATKRIFAVESTVGTTRLHLRSKNRKSTQQDDILATPPITQSTLKELELSEIFKNAQLRHDIVHDPNLQFRPNTDGDRGTKKRNESLRYWRSIAGELDTIRTWHVSQLKHNKLSVMFAEMKNVLLSLVPVGEKGQVELSFDTELFIQTLNHGLFSSETFARYISTILKRHCAPMRDEVIDKTVLLMENATESSEFADALKATFDVLEMMKLDVANHQLRTLRGYLLDTSVEFERNWYNRKYDTGVYDREATKEWFNNIVHCVRQDDLNPRRLFVAGLINIFRSTSRKPTLPATFSFDQARMFSLTKDIRELICLSLVLLLTKQVCKTMSNESLQLFKTQIWALVSSSKGSSATRWINAAPSIALHIAQHAHRASGSTGLPSSESIAFAQNWLATNLAASSALYGMIQSRLLALLENLLYHELTAVSINGHKPACKTDWSVLITCESEINHIKTRLTAIGDYHWKVHGSFYIN